MAAKQDVTKTGEHKPPAVASGDQLPDYLRDQVGKGSGLSSMESSDFIIPRVKLLQDGKREPAQFEEAKLGEFWINVLDKPLGPALDIIVCSDRKRVLLLRPLDDKSGPSILARADDGKTWNTLGEWQIKIKNVKNPVTWKITDLNVRKSGLLEFGTFNPGDPDSSPAATLFYEYLIYLPSFPQFSPAVFSLARTAAKRGRDLNAKLEFGGVPMQSRIMRVTKTDEGDGDQKYFNYQFAYNGYADQDTFTKCKQITEQFKSYRAADEEGAASEGEAGTSGPVDRGNI
jgi:hypothetical protein